MGDKLTNTGTKLYMSTALPATEDAAGYGALTWVEVKGVASVPRLGASATLVSQSDLADGIVRKAHGEVDYGGGSAQYRVITADAGQDALLAAFESKNTISFKILRSTGLIEYTQGIVMGAQTAEATSGAVYAASSDLQFSAKVIQDATGV